MGFEYGIKRGVRCDFIFLRSQIGGCCCVLAFGLVAPVSASKAQQISCVVADPTGTPLNIRVAPESPRIIGTLKNGTVITLDRIENYRGRVWARIQNLGWVYKNFLNCSGQGTPAVQGPGKIDPMFRAGVSSAVDEERWLNCTIVQEFPPQAPDTYKISLAITLGCGQDPCIVTDMGVVHHGKSGNYNRADQYVNTYLISNGDGIYTWSGSIRGNTSKIMVGNLKPSNPKNLDQDWEYSEENMQKDSRNVVTYSMKSLCHVTWKREYGDFDNQGREIIRPVVPQ